MSRGYSDGVLVKGDILPIHPSGRWVQFVAATVQDEWILSSWNEAARHDIDVVKQDAVELAEMAFKKWRAAAREGRVARSLKIFEDIIRKEPHGEITVLLLAKMPWLTSRRLAGKVAGICALHRTWCNNVYLDFLAVHPSLYRRGKPKPDDLKGIGTAALWYLALLAERIGAGAIWGEATDGSHGFYSTAFQKPIKDLIYIDKEEYTTFSAGMKARVDEKERHG